jgi:hypothetical protein
METLDLVAREPARVERMSRGLLGWMRRIEESPRAGEEKPEENAETLKALKALGYLD